MAKIKLNVSATIEETFKDFMVSRKTKGLADKTLDSYEHQFRGIGRFLDTQMDIALLKKADIDRMIVGMRNGLVEIAAKVTDCNFCQNLGTSFVLPDGKWFGQLVEHSSPLLLKILFRYCRSTAPNVIEKPVHIQRHLFGRMSPHTFDNFGTSFWGCMHNACSIFLMKTIAFTQEPVSESGNDFSPRSSALAK